MALFLPCFLVSVRACFFCGVEGHLDLEPSPTAFDKTDSKPTEPSAAKFDLEVPGLNSPLSKNTPHVLEISIDRLTCTLLALPQNYPPSSSLSGSNPSISLCELEGECGHGGSQPDAVAKLLLEEVQLTASSEQWVSGTVCKVLGVQGSLQNSSIPMHVRDIDPLDRYASQNGIYFPLESIFTCIYIYYGVVIHVSYSNFCNRNLLDFVYF